MSTMANYLMFVILACPLMMVVMLRGVHGAPIAKASRHAHS